VCVSASPQMIPPGNVKVTFPAPQSRGVTVHLTGVDQANLAKD
jgi:hypothetical protein